MLTDDGNISQNIKDIHNKGLAAANQIICLLKEAHFGQYYFEMTSLLRNATLLNGLLYSVEAFGGLKTVHIEQLEACDRYLLSKAFNAIS